MADEEKRRESDQKLYIWKEKLRFVREFISNVGIPAILVIGFAGLIGATWIGYLEPPWKDRSSVEQHAQIQAEIKDTMQVMTATHQAQTAVLQQAVGVLREMRCDMKPTDDARVSCFRKVVTND